jgi:hypothetical protein
MDHLHLALQTASIDDIQLPEPLILHILGLNEHERVWARQVCKAARDAFPGTAAVPATVAMPIWAFQWMWQNRTSLEQCNLVAAGRAAAADLPALAWLKSNSTRSSGTCMETTQVFAPAVCAAAAGAGHIHVLQWLRYATDNVSRLLIRFEPKSSTSGQAHQRRTYVHICDFQALVMPELHRMPLSALSSAVAIQRACLQQHESMC